jgi:hypothetical protein
MKHTWQGQVPLLGLLLADLAITAAPLPLDRYHTSLRGSAGYHTVSNLPASLNSDYTPAECDEKKTRLQSKLDRLWCKRAAIETACRLQESMMNQSAEMATKHVESLKAFMDSEADYKAQMCSTIYNAFVLNETDARSNIKSICKDPSADTTWGSFLELVPQRNLAQQRSAALLQVGQPAYYLRELEADEPEPDLNYPPNPERSDQDTSTTPTPTLPPMPSPPPPPAPILPPLPLIEPLEDHSSTPAPSPPAASGSSSESFSSPSPPSSSSSSESSASVSPTPSPSSWSSGLGDSAEYSASPSPIPPVYHPSKDKLEKPDAFDGLPEIDAPSSPPPALPPSISSLAPSACGQAKYHPSTGTVEVPQAFDGEPEANAPSLPFSAQPAPWAPASTSPPPSAQPPPLAPAAKCTEAEALQQEIDAAESKNEELEGECTAVNKLLQSVIDAKKEEENVLWRTRRNLDSLGTTADADNASKNQIAEIACSVINTNLAVNEEVIKDYYKQACT